MIFQGGWGTGNTSPAASSVSTGEVVLVGLGADLLGPEEDLLGVAGTLGRCFLGGRNLSEGGYGDLLGPEEDLLGYLKEREGCTLPLIRCPTVISHSL